TGSKTFLSDVSGSQFRLSPSGQWVAFVWDTDIWMLNVATKQVTNMTNNHDCDPQDSADLPDATDPNWVPDGSHVLVAYRGCHHASGHYPYGIASVYPPSSPSMGTHALSCPISKSSPVPEPDGSGYAYLQRSHLYTADPDTGAYREVGKMWEYDWQALSQP